MRTSILLISISAAFMLVVPSQAAELFTNMDLLPSEERALKASMEQQLSDAQKSIEMLDMMRMTITVQSLSSGQCDDIVEIDNEAKAGKPPSQFILGLAFYNGWCVEKNVRKALGWWRSSSDNGYTTAQLEYGRALQIGVEDVPADPPRAAKYFKMAADAGNSNAQYLLGDMYLDGDGILKDVELAESLFLQSASRGHERAIFQLGAIYMQGLLDKPDRKKAMSWFLFGASRGSAINQTLAASFLSESQKRADLIEAYKWANLGAANRSNAQVAAMAEETRDRLDKVLTPSEIQKAQVAAREFKAELNSEPPSKPEIIAAAEYEEIEDPTATPEQKAARAELKKQGIPLNRMEFFEVIQKDDLQKVKLFVRAGASLESIAIGTGDGPMGVTPLYVAVDWGALSVYRYLLDNNVNINVRASESGYTPLVRALSHKRYDIARELLKRGADASKPGGRQSIINSSALGFAVGSDHPDIVIAILNQGGSLSERYGNGMTPLHSAVTFGGSTEVIKVLLDAGSDPNEGGPLVDNPLIDCFDIEERKIRFDALNILLEAGADPNLTYDGNKTPLFAAVWLGSSEAVQILAKYGSDINRRYRFNDNNIPIGIQDATIREIIKNGGTPLMMAAAMGHIAASSMLVKLGADTSVTVKGKTGIHTAASLASKAGITIPGL